MSALEIFGAASEEFSVMQARIVARGFMKVFILTDVACNRVACADMNRKKCVLHR